MISHVLGCWAGELGVCELGCVGGEGNLKSQISDEHTMQMGWGTDLDAWEIVRGKIKKRPKSRIFTAKARRHEGKRSGKQVL